MDVKAAFAAAAVFVYEAAALLFRPAIFFNFPFFAEVKRGSCQINVPALDEFLHVAEEESEDKGRYMAAVHIGIGHDYYLVVAQFFHIQGLAVVGRADCYSQGRIDVADFLAFESAVLHGFFHVQDFTAKGQDGLRVPVPSQFRGAACRVPLHEKQFAFGRVLA